jgi:hypothetical protein
MILSLIKMTDFLFLILCLFLVIGMPLLILSGVDTFSSNVWFCRVMGWHKRPNDIGFDGASSFGQCPRCGEKVLLDSQGNWF